MAKSVQWSCACGTVAVDVALRWGTHLACYCTDCQAYARHLGVLETLDRAGGTAIFQTVPSRLTVLRGGDRLACLRMSRAPGPLRWYADCCGTPLANTLPTAKFAFSGVVLAGVADRGALGPVRMQVNTAGATGPVDDGVGSAARARRHAAARALYDRLTGRQRRNLFFHADGAPVASPHFLTDAQRARAYAAGPMA